MCRFLCNSSRRGNIQSGRRQGQAWPSTPESFAEEVVDSVGDARFCGLPRAAQPAARLATRFQGPAIIRYDPVQQGDQLEAAYMMVK